MDVLIVDIEEITKYDKKLGYHKIIAWIFMVIMGIVFVYNLVSHGPMWKIMTALLSISILILMVIIMISHM